ncbi:MULTISPECIES: hypothetical protein [Streptomyces]|uniref:hypothetical protein n=1 Tax=Streptomyces TaxID=1883 RepID=UPI001D0B5145|nr:hypothetical protein [Streptomyces longhuiensis]UDM04810.1 hypothetical protein LGI35_44650 [Streptomyces longhuiensis]
MADPVTTGAERRHDRSVRDRDRDIESALQRLGNLCTYLQADDDLREVLESDGRLLVDTWTGLAEATGQDDPGGLLPLLDAVDAAGRAAGLDGVTYTTREYRPGPFPPGPREVTGWRCPHRVACGRVELSADQSVERRCMLTGDAMTWASVSSG